MKAPTRKTFNVEAFRDKVNWRLKNCTLSDDGLSTLCQALEDVLHDTGNYNGFRFLSVNEVPFGCLPGIRNSDNPDYSVWFVDVSDFRRKYF